MRPTDQDSDTRSTAVTDTERGPGAANDQVRQGEDRGASGALFPALAPAGVPAALFQRKLLRKALARRAERERSAAAGAAAGPAPEQALVAATEGVLGDGQPVSPSVAQAVGRVTGADPGELGQARVHTGPASASAAEAVAARAFTVGSDIHFAAGQHAPGTREGDHLLAHELAHTIQQRGQSAPARQDKLEVSEPGEASEVEADRIADAAVAGATQTVPVSPAPLAVHRLGAGPPPDPSPAVAKTDAELRAMTLEAFDKFSRAQVDWHKSLSEVERKPLRGLLEFARGGPVLVGCADMKVQALLDTGLDATIRKRLSSYAAAVKKTVPTVELEPIDDVARAIVWGEALEQLNATPGGPTVRHIMKKERFIDLVDSKHVDAFVHWVQQTRPALTAAGEANLAAKDEVWSFRQLLGGGDPLRYHGTVKRVRNHHHFQNDALDQLKANEPRHNDPKKGGKPFTVILHSGLDHNAAFHQDPNITAVVTNPTNFTILVEGERSLGALSAQLKPMAAQYGGGSIHQAMIAGHGGPRGMQLAGDVAVGHDPKDPSHLKDQVTEKEDSLDLADPRQKAKTDAFLKELLATMSHDPKDPGRILLNACLTNAAELPGSVVIDPKDKDKARKQILANETLTKHLQQLADKSGASVKAVGSNASFGQVSLQDAAGNLDIVDKSGLGDPLTVSKLEYVEKGREPEGAIRAVLQAWAEDQAKCLEAMKRRIAASASTAWQETLIRAMYQSVVAAPDDAAWINELCGSIRMVGDANAEAECRVERVWGVTPGFVKAIFPALAGTDDWANLNYIPLVFNQVWLIRSAARAADLLAALDKFPTCAAAENYVSVEVLQRYTLVKVKALLGSGKAPSDARAKLAFLLLRAGDDDARAWVKELLDGKDHLDPRYLPFLKGMASESEIIEMVTRARDGSPPRKADTRKTANADLDDDGTNESYLEPFVREGNATVAVHLRKGPGKKAASLRVLYPGDKVAIIGRAPGWYAVENGASTAFVIATAVRLS